MPEKGIAKILSGKTPHPSARRGIPGCELYLYTDDIDILFARAINAGAKAINQIQDRDWGDRVGYLADPDGHIVAFASPIKTPSVI
jgi:lactoylglutathione lyase